MIRKYCSSCNHTIYWTGNIGTCKCGSIDLSAAGDVRIALTHRMTMLEEEPNDHEAGMRCLNLSVDLGWN